jgi:hypothetical protein
MRESNTTKSSLFNNNVKNAQEMRKPSAGKVENKSFCNTYNFGES